MQQEYLNSVRESIIKVLNKAQVDEMEFIFSTIYNREYKEYENFVELHISICRELLYGHNLKNIEQALKLLQVFFYFFIGSGVAVNDFIQSSDNVWDSFFNMSAFIIEQKAQQQGLLQKNKLYILAQLSGNKNLIKDVQQIEQKIQESFNINNVIKILIKIAFKDTQVLENTKKQHWIRSYKFLQNPALLEQVKNKALLVEFNIIYAYFTQDYNYLKGVKELPQNDLINKIYSLIHVDYKQISEYIFKLSDKERNQIIVSIYSLTLESQTIKIIQFGRGLKRICQWDEAIKMYMALINSGRQDQISKYLVYLYYTISKLQLLKGEVFISQQYSQFALKEIQTKQSTNQQFYQPNPKRMIKSELLIIQLVTAYIRKEDKLCLIIIDQINNPILQGNKNNQKRNINILYQLFVENFNEVKLKKKTAETTYRQSRSIVEQNIQQRKKNLKNVNPQFEANIQIHKKTQCLLELFIITQLVDINMQMVECLNSEYVPLFLIIIKIKDIINVSNVAKIFFFFGDYDKSQQLAEKVNDEKLISDIKARKNEINKQEIKEKSTDIEPQIQINKPKSDRKDIFLFYNEVKQIDPFYSKLQNQLEQFLFTTERYKIPSEILLQQMKVDKLLGSGSYGKVKKVIFQGEVYAQKITSFDFNSQTKYHKKETIQSLCSRINEINILSYIQEYKIPYIIINKHLGLRFQKLNENGLKRIKIFNLTPIYQGFNVIQEQSIDIKIQFAEKVAICLKQLQTNSISHQDIKPENILVDENLNPVLIDFGTSISNFQSIAHGSSLFSPYYVDPELERYDRKSRKNDVYSFGITLYDLFTCKRPFYEAEQTDVQFLQHKIHQNEIKKIPNVEIQSLIFSCTQPTQQKRYSLNQILYHFLMIYECRQDISDIIKNMFSPYFDDIDISDEEYELIKEFQLIAQQLQQMDVSQIQYVDQISDTLFRCQYQNTYLVFYNYKIQILDKQLAFRQILQCMRFIRNLQLLQRNNVSNIGQFYNYMLQIYRNGQEQLIQFDIFIHDDGYKLEFIKSQSQLISLLQTIQQIIDKGIFIMALDHQILLLSENNIPKLLNFLYSHRQQDEKDKNPVGWLYDKTKSNDPSIKNSVHQILTYLQKTLVDFKRKSQRQKASNHSYFQDIIYDIIDKEKDFQTVNQMIQYLSQQGVSQIQNPTNDNIRQDIKQFCQIAFKIFVPKYPKLKDYLEKFVLCSRMYKINSEELNNGMKINKIPIGNGNYGTVKKVVFNGKYFAQKISSISYRGDQVDLQQIEQFKTRLNEINILSEIQDLNIPYVLKNKHIGFIFEDKDQNGLQIIQLYILTSIYQPFEIIQNQQIQIKFQYAWKVALCLKQLQMKNVSHQDIKPDNLMADDNLDPVLIDFGISVSNFKSIISDSQVFSVPYCDPELFNDGQKNRKNDVYSFGITLYELFTCSKPIQEQGQNFLQIQAHQENIKSIYIPEIQQMIIKCAQPESRNRFSLTQVLYQFLMTNLCRKDIMVILILLMDQFDDIDITEYEYELIKEFQEISLLMPQMDSEEIQQVQQLNENLYKCQYQGNSLLFNQYHIKIDDKQLAFRQLLQCMRFIRNLIFLNKKNIQNISQFYNYRLIVQNYGQDSEIQFEIFSCDFNFKVGQLSNKQQLINILKITKQIHQNGIFMMNLQNDCILFQDDTPVIINFIYSFRLQDDLIKNQYGWPCENTQNIEELSISHELKMIKIYFECLYNIDKIQNNNQGNNQFTQKLAKILELFSSFTNIQQIMQSLQKE